MADPQIVAPLQVVEGTDGKEYRKILFQTTAQAIDLTGFTAQSNPNQLQQLSSTDDLLNALVKLDANDVYLSNNKLNSSLLATTATANKLLTLDENAELPATAENANKLGDVEANLYALKTDLPSTDNFATKAELENYVSDTELTSTLNNYVSDAELTSQLSNYVTTTSLGTTLEDYALNSELDNYVLNSATSTTAAANKLLYLNADSKLPATAFDSDKLGNVAASQYALKSEIPDVNDFVTSDALEPYITEAEVSTTLTSYVTSTNLSSTLKSYVTTSSLNSTLSGYVQDADLANYVTNSSLSATLEDYALDTDLDNYVLNSQTTTAAAANKLLYLDANSKLPATANNADNLGGVAASQYATKQDLNGYVSDSELSSTLLDYVPYTQTSMTAETNKILYLDDNAKLPATAANADKLGNVAANLYALKSEIPNDYLTSDDLAGYVTTTSLSATLESYATDDDLDNYVLNSQTTTTATANKLLYLDANKKLQATAVNADKLGNVNADLYALKADLNGYATDAEMTNATSRITAIETKTNKLSFTNNTFTFNGAVVSTGNITANNFNGNLNGIANNAAALDGVAASKYALKTDIPTDYLTSADLSGYVTTSSLNVTLEDYATTDDLNDYALTSTVQGISTRVAVVENKTTNMSYSDNKTTFTGTVNGTFIGSLAGTASNATSLNNVSASLYALKSDIPDTSNFVTNSSLSDTLDDYALNSTVTAVSGRVSTLENKTSKMSVNGTTTTFTGTVNGSFVGNLAGTAALASEASNATSLGGVAAAQYALKSDLSDFLTSSDLASYVTTSQLSSTLSSYVTSSSLSSQLSNYIQTSAASTTAKANKLLYLDANGKLQATANNAEKLGGIAASQYALKSDITGNNAFDSDGHLVSPAGWKLWITNET